MIGATTTSSASSNSGSSISETVILDTMQQPAFEPEQCLFCNKTNDDFESNLLHMQTAHGLFIPDKQRLIVEPQVLVKYLHLVIHGDNECICCGTQRNSAEAVQQHMLGKGHCRFDISQEGSEFADFWNSSESEGDEQDTDGEVESANKGQKRRTSGIPVRLDDTSLKLPSGRVVSKQSASQQSQRRSEARTHRAVMAADDAEFEDTSSSKALISTSRSGSKSISKSEKRDHTFITQLSRLSDNDRRSLMHLPASQQRSILATQQKQAEKAKRVERRYQSRVEGLGNKTLQAHFRPDGPARANG